MDPIGIVAAIQTIPGVGPYLPYVTMLITLAAVIAPFLPGPKQDTGVYAAFYYVVNLIAVNRGHATNLNSPAAAGVVAGPGANDAPKMAVVERPAAPNEPPAVVPAIPASGVKP